MLFPTEEGCVQFYLNCSHIKYNINQLFKRIKAKFWFKRDEYSKVYTMSLIKGLL